MFVVATRKMSNGKGKDRSNFKNVNRYLALAFMQATKLATSWKPKFKLVYQKE